jgi:serine/threonine protein kinase
MTCITSEQLQTEIKIHKSLYHRHVVRFEDVFEDKENVYIIMELCSNQVTFAFPRVWLAWMASLVAAWEAT